MHILSLRTWGKVNAFIRKKYRKPIVQFIILFVRAFECADLHKLFPILCEEIVPPKVRFTHVLEW